MSSQRVISTQATMSATHAATARVVLFRSVVSWRIVSRSAILLARVRVQLDVSAPVLLAAFWCSVGVQRLVRTVAFDAQASSREAVFLHQVLLDGIGALARELHVIGPLAGGVGIAFDID